MIDIDKFVASLMEFCPQQSTKYINALADQGLAYKDGKIESIEQDESFRKRYERIGKSEWFKKTHEGMSITLPEDLKGTDQDGGVKGEMGGLTEFENRLVGALDYARRHRRDVTDEALICDAKAISKELLAIARKEFLDKACGYLFKWNENQVRKFGSKATLSCTDFTISGNDFRKYMEE